MNAPAPPVVLVFAGSDPTGGAGIAADVLTLASLGCHAAPVVTAVTAQDTAGVKQFDLVDPELVIAQARAVLEDMPVAAVKTGMLGSTATVAAVESIMRDYPRLPLIVDPVQASDRGDALSAEALDDALRALLIPRALLVTPNSLEARALAPSADTLDACAQDLLSLGAQYVLITGTHEPSAKVQNRLYGNRRLLDTFTFERLPNSYHGSGCTLAAACAGVIAHGLDPVNAITQAVHFTYDCLRHAYRAGMGQLLPDRLYWSRKLSAFKTDA
jgi:hydroxymethylpyrimidine/phosphomethylpyrimidine kinase